MKCQESRCLLLLVTEWLYCMFTSRKGQQIASVRVHAGRVCSTEYRGKGDQVELVPFLARLPSADTPRASRERVEGNDIFQPASLTFQHGPRAFRSPRSFFLPPARHAAPSCIRVASPLQSERSDARSLARFSYAVFIVSLVLEGSGSSSKIIYIISHLNASLVRVAVFPLP